QETVEGSGHAIVHNEPRDNIKPFLDKKYDLIAIDHQKPQDKIAKIRDWQRILNWIRNEVPGVVAAAPTVNGNAVAVYGTKQMAIEVIGIEPREQVKVTSIGDKLVEGSERGFDRLASTANGILLGDGLARLLGASIDDTISVTGPTGTHVTARVVGIFSTGVTPVDYSRSYMLLRDSQVLLDKQNIISEITVRGTDPSQARALAAQIEANTNY